MSYATEKDMLLSCINNNIYIFASLHISAVYLTTLLSLSTMSVLSSGVVMNMIHQESDKPVPYFLRCLVCCRLRQLRQQLRKGRFQKRVDTFRKCRHGQRTFSAQENGCTEMRNLWPNGDFTKERHFSYDNELIQIFSENSHAQSEAVRRGMCESRIDGRAMEDDLARAENTAFFDLRSVSQTYPDEWALITWMDVGSAVDTLLFWTFLGFTVTSTMIVLILFSAQ